MFDLDPVPRYRLARPPLVQALGQIRYPIRATLQTLDGVVGLQQRLQDRFPYMSEDQIQQVSLLMGPGMPPAGGAQTSRAWRFTDDAGWTLLVAPDAATLSVGPEYGDFDEFSARFGEIIAALHEAAQLPRCDRLGLRYIDVAPVSVPGEKQAWGDWFRPELTGWSAGPIVSESTRVVTSITQTQLLTGPPPEFAGLEYPVQGIIRHGYVPPHTMVPGLATPPVDAPAFLLDIDLYIEGHQPFEADALAHQITMLHDQIDRFFRWSLTPAGADHFGLEELT
jgi:uncharacterized protein (TIGR04255 family)